MEQIDAQATMTGTMDVPEQDRLDEASLTRWFEGNVEGFEGPLTLSKFKGGQSNPTYKVTTPKAAYVLRRKPFGPLLPSAHAVDREYRVQAALYDQGFPVSRQFGLCEDDSVIGSMFYVMAFTDGASYWDGTLPGKTPEQRTAIYNAMIDTLAHLHSFDPAAIGLEDYGKPGNYCARQISRWTKQYRLSETETIPEMDQLIEWLEKTVPEQRGVGMQHLGGDLPPLAAQVGAREGLPDLRWRTAPPAILVEVVDGEQRAEVLVADAAGELRVTTVPAAPALAHVQPRRAEARLGRQ